MFMRLLASLVCPLMLLLPAGGSATSLIGDPQIPPIADSAPEPNVLIILDHSGSMDKTVNADSNETRWKIAKDTLSYILDNTSGMRFGLMRLDGSNANGADQISVEPLVRQGGKILRPCGTPNNEIKAYIQHPDWTMPDNPQTWTNLAETLADAGRYFATEKNDQGARVGMGPPGLGYYTKDYKYILGGDASTQYFAIGTDDRGQPIDTTSPIKGACQSNFAILITDGEANSDNDWDVVTQGIGNYVVSPLYSSVETGDCVLNECQKAGTYLDDVAAFLYDHDLRSDLADPPGGKQNLTTYVIGFDIENNLLREAARVGKGGEGKLLLAGSQNTESLKAALLEILEDIRAQTFSGTGVSIAADSTASDDYLLRSSFNLKSRRGSLSAVALPLAPDVSPNEAPVAWTAEERLASLITGKKRKIYTSVEGLGLKTEFSDTLSLRTYFSAADRWNLTPTETTLLIGRLRDLPLGTIIHSTPVTVGPPKFHHLAKDYPQFRQAQRNRPTMIYSGANDGMLHAFYAFGPATGSAWQAGDEAWAYIPSGVQAKLPLLDPQGTDAGHRYFVDLQPTVNDVWDTAWNNNTPGWRTLLVGGNRFGGEQYFALDVTDPRHDQFQVLWEAAPHAGAKSSLRPAIAPIQSADADQFQWAAILTSGFQEDGNSGGVCALRVSDGQKLAIWQGDDGQMTNHLATQAKSATAPYYTMSEPVTFDSDGDGRIDLIYAGDTEGILWKFYWDFEEQVWKKKKRFTTGGQPITGKPALVLDRQRNLRVYFGTGQFLVERDKSDTRRNAFYCLIEKRFKALDSETADANEGSYLDRLTTPESPANLVEVTSLSSSEDVKTFEAANNIALSDYSWYFSLDNPISTDPATKLSVTLPAERVVGHPLVLAGVVFFASFTPNDDICGFGGAARLYAVTYNSGIQARVQNETVLKTDRGADLPAGQRWGQLGNGLPAELVWHYDRSGHVSHILTQTSDSTVVGGPVRLPARPMSLQGWRELEN